MTSFRVRTGVLVACIALTAAPSFAQRGERRSGGDGGGRENVQRAEPRGGGQVGGRGGGQANGREARRPAEPRARVETQRRAEPRSRAEPRQQVAPPARVETEARVEPRGRLAPSPRLGGSSLSGGTYTDPQSRDRSYVNRPPVNRPPVNRAPANRSYVNRAPVYRPPVTRSYVDRSYVGRPSITRSYVRRSYVQPYGYRPSGYRPGWSVNLYFGRPFAAHGYRVYDVAPRSVYGYYAVVPGIAFGALRILDAPRDAHVFVDGYYAGVVDDYDGVFQRLNLEAGSHHIEIEAEGYPLIAFDVRIQPGQTITYRANVY